mmetsp:Transcript_18332/g.29380  ORF Transcript_18332/g.29380 Transcript_18332/m.29380 type:complete len:449 (+) Transcript_18332:4301-5647(+)
MPICCLTGPRSNPGSAMSTPSKRTWPSSTGSNPFIQRSKVDLPDPDAPIRHSISPRPTSRSMPLSTDTSSNDLVTPRSDTLGSGIAILVHQVVGIARGRHGHAEEDDSRRHVRREIGEQRFEDARLPQNFDGPDEGQERHVLLQRHEHVHIGGHHTPDGLRQDHVAHRVPLAEAKADGSVALAGVDAFDARAQHLGHIGRVGQHQRHSAPDIGRVPRTGEAEPRNAKAHQVNQQDHGNAPKEVDIDGTEDAQREQGWVVRAARQRNGQTHGKDHRHRPGKDGHVQQESAGEVGEGPQENLAVEKGGAHGLPPRGEGDEEKTQEQDKRCAAPGNQVGAAALPRLIGGPSCHLIRGTPVASCSHWASIAARLPLAVIAARASSTQVFSAEPSGISAPNWSGFSAAAGSNWPRIAPLSINTAEVNSAVGRSKRAASIWPACMAAITLALSS